MNTGTTGTTDFSSENVQPSIEDSKEKVKTYLSDMKKDFKENFENAKTAITNKSREVSDITDSYVRDNPWKTAGIAAGIGLLFGLLMSRRGSEA
jgi:ElaB/YqjD/DUF883 family membrane-anchored ribosome-binding protein